MTLMAARKRRAVYTEQMDAFIRQHHLLPAQELADKFNQEFGTDRTSKQLHGARKARGLKTGRTGRFQPGNEPGNKGTHYSTIAGRKTQFKQGHRPANEVPLYSERLCTRDGYILIKVPERNPYTGCETRFVHKHQWLWTLHNGPIPKGHVVVFIDGDKLNCVIENLELVTRRELLERNRMKLNEQPEAIKPVMKTLAKFNVRTRERSEQHREAEQ